jgi:hypothetical protein
MMHRVAIGEALNVRNDLGSEIGPGAGRMGGLERVMGIEPTPSAWEAEVLPLNYTRFSRKRLYSIPAWARHSSGTWERCEQGVG